MSGVSDKHNNSEFYAREFIKRMLVLGNETAHHIAKAVETANVQLPMTDTTSMHISLAIIGTSLCILKDSPKIMSHDHGTKVEVWCKKSIKQDYGFDHEAASELIETIDEYQNIFKQAVRSKVNPFGEISGVLLTRLLGPRAESICLKGTEYLNPFIHQIVGDIMTLTITDGLSYWKEVGS